MLNEKVVEFALRLGEAFHFDVPERSIFHRKNYFYPDMPKDFQTSQYDAPICVDGYLEVDGAHIRIERAHMEEDTGKTTHVGGGGRIHDADHSLVDYNRAGVPLMEIVSRPDIRSAEQAKGYVTELRAVLEAIGVSDVKMEEGSMRVDANVSVRPVGSETLGTRAEIKNMNSVRSLGRAVEYEIARQIDLRGVGRARRAGDAPLGRGRGHHPRHALEGGLGGLPLLPRARPRAGRADRRDARRGRGAAVGELPAARRARFVDDWGVSETDARTLLESPGLADYAEAAVAAGAPGKDVTNWLAGEVLGYLNETGLSPAVLPFPPDALAELVGLVADGTLSRNLAKDVLAEGLRDGEAAAAVVEDRGLAQVNDEGELGALVDAVLAANADASRNTAAATTSCGRRSAGS